MPRATGFLLLSASLFSQRDNDGRQDTGLVEARILLSDFPGSAQSQPPSAAPSRNSVRTQARAAVGPMHCARNRTLLVLTTPPAISKKGRSGNG